MAIDVTDQTFEKDVIERSHTVPVVVDFWAEWCGPCRSLGPVIEAAVEERNGQVELAKVDTDANQNIARAYRIQSIPAVKAFTDGEVVAEFVGAQPPVAVKRFLDGLVPSEADGLIEAGDEASLRRALELEPGRADAAVPLARIVHERGEDDEALEILGDVPGSFAADGLAARIELERSGDPEIAKAFELLDAGDTQAALDALLAAFPTADGRRDDLRRAFVGILDQLGTADPTAREYRRKLATALY